MYILHLMRFAGSIVPSTDKSMKNALKIATTWYIKLCV